MSEDTIPAQLAPSLDDGRVEPGRMQRLAKRLLLERMARIRSGGIEVHDADGTRRFGEPAGPGVLQARIEVLHPQFWADAAFGGITSAGESYIHGLWKCDDLTALVRILLANREVLDSLNGGAMHLTALGRRIAHWLNRNSREGSRRNIAAHYDLGNDLFRLFLDPTMNYSCGIFEHDDATLEQASIAKMDAACRKLDLKPSDHLLEIGTGWGALAVHAARNYGCRVTTTTISREQHALAAERIRAAGLEDRVTLLLSDYRDLDGQYDKLVSIEMIEAVGHQYLDTYFETCARRLKPDGLMLLQAITIRDQLYQRALKSVDFIQRFVFPGGFLPSVAAMSDSMARTTDLQLLHLQDIGLHYATTLRRWRERFLANLGQVREQGYPDSFIRLWEYYLCYCEGGFLERNIGTVQMLLAKPRNRRPSLAY
ncbi:cyclopropane-fatty-acyl-phospholipid synthase family protein [Thioalkalivibrio sp. XN8]|uniref:SAM-dependent methyltransferase n=1 Tax=Thioalkalivibrio sp. XN8 TaxID=2712863 RepID=UPI00197E376D|nr:cyclopropane-fatty-acyl-phospholipid synthase family protein [Thioalkalivibrio sp. XN8]